MQSDKEMIENLVLAEARGLLQGWLEGFCELSIKKASAPRPPYAT